MELQEAERLFRRVYPSEANRICARQVVLNKCLFGVESIEGHLWYIVSDGSISPVYHSIEDALETLI